MIKKIELNTKVDTVNFNGVVYRKDVMEKIVLRMNQLRFIPVTMNICPDECSISSIGRIIPGTAEFDGKTVHLEIDIDDHVERIINSDNYIFDCRLIAKLDKDCNVVVTPNFNIIELQIIKKPNRRQD